MIDTLFFRLSQLPQVEAIALGGSRAGENYDERSDYDVYLYITAPISEAVRRALLKDFCTYMEIGNHFWEYEDNCTLNNGIDIDILYRDLDAFSGEVANVVEKGQARNGYTTCMWHNLLTCKVIFDRNGRLAAAKARFSVPYPEVLRNNILSQNWRLLRGSMPAYEEQIRKASKRGDLVSVNHRVSAFLESYFDLIFALNRQTHPGEKRLVSLCRQSCPILPENFSENLNLLFHVMFQDPERLSQVLDAMLTALEDILPAQHTSQAESIR